MRVQPGMPVNAVSVDGVARQAESGAAAQAEPDSRGSGMPDTDRGAKDRESA